MSELNSDQKRSIFREWLEKLQQESWQLELLISGFALYGIWAGKDFVSGVQDYVVLNRPSFFVDSIPILAGKFLEISWKIFFLNLLTHVIFRGIWIGTIGLRYVSGDIDYDSLNYSAVMTDYLKRRVGGFDEFIERLEKFCSVLFAYTFLLFFLFLSLIMYVIWFNLFAVVLVQVFEVNGSGTVMGIFLLVFLGISLLVFVDFITFGAFKRIQERRIALVYKYVYIISSYATLSFLYRPLLYNFIDDRYTKRLILWSIPYFIVVILIVPGLRVNAPFYPEFNEDYYGAEVEMDKEVVKWWNYDDLRTEVKTHSKQLLNSDTRIIDEVSLSTYEVDGDYLQFFIRQSSRDEKLLANSYKLIPFNTEGLSHAIAGVINEDDAVLDSILAKNKERIKQFRRNSDALKKENNSLYLQRIDSLSRASAEEKKNYFLKKLHDMKEASFEMYEVYIDTLNCTEALDCKFFIHQNAGEKGFNCFLAIDSLSRGSHLFSLRRARSFDEDGIATWRQINIPFFRK